MSPITTTVFAISSFFFLVLDAAIMLYFKSLGHSVFGIDAEIKFVEHALDLGLDVCLSKVEDMAFYGVFDCVWACASLLHIPSYELVDVLKSRGVDIDTTDADAVIKADIEAEMKKIVKENLHVKKFVKSFAILYRKNRLRFYIRNVIIYKVVSCLKT